MKQNNPYYYLGANPTVDLVIINPQNEVLMIKRADDSPACAGLWALPGGFIDTVSKKGQPWVEGLETPEQAAIREVQEETNLTLNNPNLTFVGIFEGNGRDPRDNEESWSKSYSFLYKISTEEYSSQSIVGTDDASEAKWIDVNMVQNMKLAFDHNEIIKTAIKKMSPSTKMKF